MSKHQYEYRKAMDSIHVSREWEDDMIQKILNAEKAQKKRIHRAHRLGLAAVAAAA